MKQQITNIKKFLLIAWFIASQNCSVEWYKKLESKT